MYVGVVICPKEQKEQREQLQKLNVRTAAKLPRYLSNQPLANQFTVENAYLNMLQNEQTAEAPANSRLKVPTRNKPGLDADQTGNKQSIF
jgi:hypothetical protein